MPRPELGKLAVGDQVLVIPGGFFRNKPEPVLATVTKVARVWVEMKRSDGDGWPKDWRFRLDTQHDGTDSNYRARFFTPEQYAWKEKIDEARETLRAAKIFPEYSSPWHTDEDRLTALADFVRAYNEQHPKEN